MGRESLFRRTGLNDTALREMNRRNMRLNDWKALVEWLSAEGLECYAELIWGAPGETAESFLTGYDELALHIPRIATYPLMILPNTDYHDRRAEFGLVTSRGQSDDFEYVLATNTMSFQKNLEMQGFLLWARAAAENSFFRYIWRPVLRYAGLSQSQVLFKLANWFDAHPDEATGPVKAPETIVQPLAVNAAVRALFLDPRIRELLLDWWQEEIRPLVKAEYRDLVDEVFRFDMLTLPRTGADLDPTAVEEEGRHTRVHRSEELFTVDVPALVATLRDGGELDPERQVPTMFEFVWRLGLEAYIDNHEEALLHMATVAVRTRSDPPPNATPLPAPGGPLRRAPEWCCGGGVPAARVAEGTVAARGRGTGPRRFGVVGRESRAWPALRLSGAGSSSVAMTVDAEKTTSHAASLGRQ